ncbi:MAG: response regulator transcription factor [Bacteroidales bacterium]|nr:response regulator transcription factor [Bacteroidales bacterium]
MKLINCVLVDDDPLALERMEALLELTGRVKIIQKMSSPEAAPDEIMRIQPDMVFLDVEMPGLSGFEVVKMVRLHDCFPTFVFVTGYNQYAIKAIKAEAFDYLLKPVDLDELNDCLTRYQENKQPDYFRHFYQLSDREKEIQRLVAEGKTSLEIAEILFISKNTADTHRRNIRKKLKDKS